MDAITTIFTSVGQVETIQSAYLKLINYYLMADPSDPYVKSKASGSIGGSSRSGYIKLINNHWVRMR